MKVVAGELTGMEGRVVRIDEEGMVHVRAKDLEGVTEALEIEPRDLVKHFNVRTCSQRTAALKPARTFGWPGAMHRACE